MVRGFEPENATEARLAEEPALGEGWAWGRPRRGHPEGSVGNHVADLLRMIDASGETGQRRADLRFVALVHDSLKVDVDHSRSRTGENHHAMRARRLAERYVDDERLLAAIELHDAPYAIWRRVRRSGSDGEHAFDRMMERIPDRDLFARFVELDGSTGGKDPAPVEWFKLELARHGARGPRGGPERRAGPEGSP